MTFAPTPGQTTIQTGLRAFLLSILPAGVEVAEAQDNRISEPGVTEFVIMTPILRGRIGTNADTYADVSFQASIALTTLTVSSVNFGKISIGSTLFGLGVTAGTTILQQLTGSPLGGVGTYKLSASQSVGSEKMAAGNEMLLQPTQVDVQLDVHSADLATASDMAQTISTLFRDDYACAFFAASYPGIVPLYADDPKQIGWQNDQQQWESRYVITASLQCDQSVVVSRQFADTLTPQSIPVDATFPA
jgi:hypothetical protein